jgi:acyl-CoA synthetase (AMP-forming)/AMP-acid ligase II
MITNREFLERNAAWRSDRPALRLVDRDETLTWAEFDDRANRVGHGLADMGVRAGDRVAIALHNVREFPLAVYGCYKIGAVPVPINYMLAPDTFAYIIDDVNPQVAIYDGAVADRFERAAESAIRSLDLVCTDASARAEPFERLESAGSTDPPPAPPVQPDTPAYILYTSGTTGDPKGVVITAETAFHRALEMVSTVDFTQASVTLQLSPWFHAGGIDNTVHQTVVAGGELLVTDEFEPVPALSAIDRYGVTHISSVPTLTRRIAAVDDLESYDRSSVRCWINMGSPLTEADARSFMERLTPNIFNNYGTTETLTDTVLRPDDLPEHAGTVGRPNVDTRVRVVESDPGRRVDPDETVAVGEQGEVIVSAETRFDYYFGDTGATRDAVVDGWFYTGDIGSVDDEGYLTVTGRADDLINTGGELVAPVEVEETLESHGAVEGAVVVGEPSEEWGEAVAAYVVADGVSAADLDAHCRDHDGLADFKRPRSWTFLDELERTATGKKQRYRYRD